jgi:hypothetical protein
VHHVPCVKSIAGTSILIALLAGSAASVAEPAQPKPQPTAKAQKPPAIDPQAISALDKMGAFLRRQQSFSVRTSTQTDYVLEDGQKVTRSARGDLIVRRPDHLRVEMVSDNKHREYFYDGKTFTIFSPQIGFYATLPAPPTLNGLADLLQTRYGLDLPLVDLFRWGTEDTDITAARYIGPTRIDGVVVDQYAFRQPGVDWQIWIQRGAEPVPRKLVLTTTDDPARPEHSVELTWTLNAKHEDRQFAFTPPKDATRIAIRDLESMRAKATKERRATRSVRR